jgi:hypothetical protein
MFDNTEQFAVWRAAPGNAHLWWTFRPEVLTLPLESAIAKGTGISSGSAQRLSVLLMPDEVGGFSLATDWVDDAVNPTYEQVDGRMCVRVDGHSSNDARISLWLDPETFLMRKFLDGPITTIYYPEVDISLDDKIFDFQPPSGDHD